MFKKLLNCFIVLTTVFLVACSQSPKENKSDLNIIGGSELKAIAPLIDEASNQLGFSINIKYVGTIDGVETVKAGSDYDIAWFGNSKYFYDTPESAKLIKSAEKIMLSPVIIGVKEDSFIKNKLSKTQQYSWKDIAEWVSIKHMTYAATDPSTSNSGYVALMGVVYSTSNSGENISVSNIKKDVLIDFFKGQKITAKSSNWIMDAFNKSTADFVVNYETAILNNPVKLIPVYPNEGIVTSDYQMLLLNSNKQEQYKQLVDFLKTKSSQEKLVNVYKYRSILPEVMASQTIFNDDLLVEMPFNPNPELSDAILLNYFNDYKKPSKFVFVVDTSGSMAGDRETSLKTTINDFVNGSIGKFATIRNREYVTVIPFSTAPYDLVTFDSSHKNDFNSYIQKLSMDNGTAMYDGVEKAIDYLIKQQEKDGDTYRYSIIVLTDGMSNEGSSLQEFKDWYSNKHIKEGDIRVFPIAFGDSDEDQLKSLATITGGNLFSGKTSLSSAFKEIRSYQ